MVQHTSGTEARECLQISFEVVNLECLKYWLDKVSLVGFLVRRYN